MTQESTTWVAKYSEVQKRGTTRNTTGNLSAVSLKAEFSADVS